MHPALLFVLTVVLALMLLMWRAVKAARRAEFIRSEPLPKGLYDKLRQRRPALSQRDCQLVAQGLRQFFLAYLQGGRKTVSMPSQVVDELWHEFILHTRGYDAFCRRAFGRFLHHTPAVAMGGPRSANEGLRRVWWQACRAENINPRAPARLPLLFAIDAKLKIEGGFHYVPDCGPLRSAAATAHGDSALVLQCGGDFSSITFDGGTEGMGDDSGSGSDGGGGDGGGCGGGGCSD